MRAHGAINLRQVPLRLRDQFHAVCALRGTTMTRRLIELIEADVERSDCLPRVAVTATSRPSFKVHGDV